MTLFDPKRQSHTHYNKNTSQCVICNKVFQVDGRGVKRKYCREHQYRNQSQNQRNYNNHLLEFFALAHLEADQIIEKLYGGESY